MKFIFRIIRYTILPVFLLQFFSNLQIEIVNPINKKIIFSRAFSAYNHFDYISRFFKKERSPLQINDTAYSFNGIIIYKKVSNQRHFASDGYCYGKIGQCVEFVKRYYHDYLHHNFPNQWGHAKSFYNPNLKDGAFNTDRALYQFRNGSYRQPRVNDIIVFTNTYYGHVAIISEVTKDYIIIKQQHCKNPTKKIKLNNDNNKWKIEDNGCVAFLSLNK